MLFRPDTLAGIAEGRIDLAFRRWDVPRVRVGGRQRTAIGVIGFEAVERVRPDEVTDQEARRAGFGSRDELLAVLGRKSGDIHRVRLRLVGPDPRVVLRETLPDPSAVEEVVKRLARLDRLSSHGPWTRATLEAIAARPQVRAGDLATGLGRERLPFKLDVRKLKELGLTESLPIGYRISPRGRAVLAALSDADARPTGRRTRSTRRRQPGGR